VKFVMANPEPADSRVRSRPIPTWGFWATAFFGAVAYGVFMSTAGLFLAFLAPEGQAMQGRWQGAALIIGTPPAIAVIWVAIREARQEFAEYLALNWPDRDDAGLAVLINIILLIGWALIVPRPDAGASVLHPYLSVAGAGGLMMLLVGGCIAGPMMEEFIFRGFLFRGWSETFLGPIGAILLISIIWALTHTQYDWFGRSWIFVEGLALGYLRWRSASTWLTVIMHSAMNILSFFTLGRYT
jgi:membrane protease YdiL (CAAX protease family)